MKFIIVATLTLCIGCWVKYCELATDSAAARASSYVRHDRKHQRLWAVHEARYQRLKRARALARAVNV
jgi:hypothetical protein